MTPATPLHLLLAQLHAGDDDAAERLYRAYEPFLRIVVRRQLSAAYRARFDSTDIVQSAWADLLRHFRQSQPSFADADHLQAFLVKAVYNRFIDRFRQHRRSVDTERCLHTVCEGDLPARNNERPSACARANEIWDRLQSICSPVQSQVCELRRQGTPIDEIARCTGLHPGSVRRILYDVARKLGVTSASATEARTVAGPTDPHAVDASTNNVR